MRIDLNDDLAMHIRVSLLTNAWRTEDQARKYSGDRASIARLFRRRADKAFIVLNDFRVACGEQPYTLERIMGEDEDGS